MAINNIQNTKQIINYNEINQSNNATKLGTGFKVNRDNDVAATLKIKANGPQATENSEAVMSDINAIDKVDGVINEAKQNILVQPEDSLKAQANATSTDVTGLVQ